MKIIEVALSEDEMLVNTQFERHLDDGMNIPDAVWASHEDVAKGIIRPSDLTMVTPPLDATFWKWLGS